MFYLAHNPHHTERERELLAIVQHERCPKCGGQLDTDGESVWCAASDCDGPQDDD